MPTYTATETGRLAGLLPETRQLEERLRVAANAAGIFYEIPKFGGTRTTADQALLVKWRNEAVDRARVEGFQPPGRRFIPPGDRAGRAAWYPVADTTKSYHGSGAAFDVKILIHSEVTEDAAYRKLAQIAEDDIGLRAGYFFRTGPNGVNDPFHFQLRKSLDTVRVIFAEFAPKATPVILIGIALGGLFALGGGSSG